MRTILFSFLLFLQVIVYAQTKHIIQNSGETFVPDALTGVKIGDTIEWQWTGGSHNTASTTIPDGAEAWTAPLDESHQTFLYKVLVSGTYQYVCTFHEAAGMTGSFTVDQSTGISNISYLKLTVSPNPATNDIRITFNNPLSGPGKLTIYDLLGNTLLSRTIETNAKFTDYMMDISQIKEGLYFIDLNANGVVSSPIKILKK